MTKNKKTQFELQLEDITFEVTIKYRKKRGVSYYVDFESIIVNSGYFYSENDIKRMLLASGKKIVEMSKKSASRVDLNKYESVLNRESYLFMGNIIPIDKEFIPYKRLFHNKENVINEIYYDTLNKLNVKNVGLIVKPLTSKWGSYNARTNVITLNLYLLFFDRPCIEYVICHEVCHIGNLSHNRRFHSDLDKICSNNRLLRQRINQLTTLTRKLQKLE